MLDDRIPFTRAELFHPLGKSPKMPSWLMINSASRMVAQIDKYGDRLFADPIVGNTPNGSVTIYRQRTNNIIEQFFRDLKRSHRRRTGNNSMSRVLNSMLADTPLVKNLDNPEYMDMPSLTARTLLKG